MTSNTSRFVRPEVFLVGFTTTNKPGLEAYLKYSGNEEFLEAWDLAIRDGVAPAEALISVAAKLCYKSLCVGANANVESVRDVKGNLAGVQHQAHGSVMEHVSANFIVTDCSRVYTHEQVRHRLASYSQTSGRYCRIDLGSLQLAWDPILDGCEHEFCEALDAIEKCVYMTECKKNLRKPPGRLSASDCPAHWTFSYRGDTVGLAGQLIGLLKFRYERLSEEIRTLAKYGDLPGEWPIDVLNSLPALVGWVPTTKADGVNFDYKKKLTSAIRRIAPNGQTNEMFMTLNIRSLRHTIMMRTARFAEWEIRVVYEQVYQLMKEKFPLLFVDAIENRVDGLIEVSGMRMNPYDRKISDYSDEELQFELNRRRGTTQAAAAETGSGAEELPEQK